MKTIHLAILTAFSLMFVFSISNWVLAGHGQGQGQGHGAVHRDNLRSNKGGKLRGKERAAYVHKLNEEKRLEQKKAEPAEKTEKKD